MLRQKVSQYELTVKIQSQKGGGYVAASPDWSDCYAQGETIDEAVLEVTAVAQSLIELYREERLKIPLKLASEKRLASPLSVPIIVSA